MPLTGAWPLATGAGRDGVGGRVIQRGTGCAEADQVTSPTIRLSRKALIAKSYRAGRFDRQRRIVNRRPWSAFKNQAGGRPVDQQAALGVGDTPIRDADPAAPAEHRALGPDRTCLRRDRPLSASVTS